MTIGRNHLNWLPLGFARKRLGPVKLVPLSEEQRKDFDVQHYEDNEENVDCTANVDDQFRDLPNDTYESIRRCFRRVRNCLLRDVVPLERRINYSEDQCVNFCGHNPRCRSLSYSRHMAVCDVYDLKNGTDNARLVSYVGYRYYEPKTSSATDCWQAKLSRNFQTPSPATGVVVDSGDSNELSTEAPDKSNQHRDVSEAVTDVPRDMCTTDKDVVVFKSTGYRLREFGLLPIRQNSSETECIFSCLINLAHGQMPYQCASASYGEKDGDCELYGAGANVHGNGHLVPDLAYTHYEKGCITSDLVELCKGYPLVREPQKTLLGFATATVLAGSLIECLEFCFLEYRRGANCKSVMYFYDEPKRNCILNSESKESAAAFFVDEAEVLVDYASFSSSTDLETDLIHTPTPEESANTTTTPEVPPEQPPPTGPDACPNDTPIADENGLPPSGQRFRRTSPATWAWTSPNTVANGCYR
ncbi:PAN domain containing protein [Aphelenchoides avenae]|nr:PAN domain containing protein [Aphelenchus avenae]